MNIIPHLFITFLHLSQSQHHLNDLQKILKIKFEGRIIFDVLRMNLIDAKVFIQNGIIIIIIFYCGIGLQPTMCQAMEITMLFIHALDTRIAWSDAQVHTSVWFGIKYLHKNAFHGLCVAGSCLREEPVKFFIVLQTTNVSTK